MKHFFISRDDHCSTHWLKAFPEAVLVQQPETIRLSEGSFIWLMDSFPQAESVLLQFKQQGCSVVVLSLTPSVQQSLAYFAVGASGYCHALAATTMLHQVVESVQAGGIWIGAELMQQMVQRVAQQTTPTSVIPEKLALLTGKERQVAELVAQGMTNKEVAKLLDISDRTVKAHLTVAFEKLQVRDRIHLALLLKV
jgi:two-component system nitrate/nitrite response regulator NarL